MNLDVTAMGELLIDFTQNGKSEQGNDLFEANPGGAPCNVLAMLTRLGKKTAFIGKVGDDHFGHLLLEVITAVGIDSRGLMIDPVEHTTLAFVHNTPDGDRDFSFYRNPGADQQITAAEVQTDLIQNSKIFHFGSLSLTHSPARQATQTAVAAAKKANVTISFDPNLRPPLWYSMEEARQQIAWGCGQCDVLKISEEELFFLTDQQDIPSGVILLRRQYPNIQLILVTKGKEGAEAFIKNLHVSASSFLWVKTIDTTGAGDTFCGNCLAYLLDHDIHTLTENQLSEMLTFANAAASLVTTKRGAIRSMPTQSEIESLLHPHVL
ncbi:MAG: Sugar kinase, ribokinase family [Caproiciproducens sp.]|nr:Sugar kinase, ribokinase family [Caproiciproducens sp.]